MQKIGLSLSLCIKDLINNNIEPDEVKYIVTMTRAVDEDGWAKLISIYCSTHWKDHEIEAVNILNTLRKEGKIRQPRVANQDYWHSINDGIWSDTDPVNIAIIFGQ